MTCRRCEAPLVRSLQNVASAAGFSTLLIDVRKTSLVHSYMKGSRGREEEKDSLSASCEHTTVLEASFSPSCHLLLQECRVLWSMKISNRRLKWESTTLNQIGDIHPYVSSRCDQIIDDLVTCIHSRSRLSGISPNIHIDEIPWDVGIDSFRNFFPPPPECHSKHL